MHNRDVEEQYLWIKAGTRSRLSASPRLRIVSLYALGNSKEVQVLQLPAEAGFNPGYTDKRMDPTQKLLNRLQIHYGLRPTGHADNNVLSLLDLRR